MPTPLDLTTLPNNVAALRGLLLQREAEYSAEHAQHAAELQAAHEGLKAQVLRNEQLKLRLAKLLRERFGASSEKLHGAIEQLELLLGDLEERIAETAPVAVEPAPASATGETKRRKPVRRPLPENLPRDVVAHAAPCACPQCGGALRPLGEDVTEVLDYVPGTFRVIRHVRPKLSCRQCESIAQAPAPELPIRRGLAGAGMLAHVLVAKYCDHLPLYRQAEIYARNGIDLDRSTLADWVGQTAALVRPLVDAVAAHVMAAERVHADDTTVPVLDPGRGKTKTGRLWCYARDDRPFAGPAPPAVLYRYSPDRKGEHPRGHLAAFRGILQADGYAGFAGLYERGVTEAACWAHARRKFFDVHAATQSPMAHEALQRIAALYAVEATLRGEPPETRRQGRARHSAPLLDELKRWLENCLGRISGKSDLAGAIRYTLTRWDALTLVLRDGRACLDNNAAERVMRPMAMPESLYPSCSSIWKHWDLIVGRDVTRAPFAPNRLHDSRGVQVCGEDLERRAGNDLFGAKDAGVDQLAYPMAISTASLRRLAQGKPGSVLLGRFVRANAADPSDRADAMGRPGFALSGRQAHPVEGGGDVLVGPAARHAANDRQSIVGRAASVFTGAGFAQPQFGVLPALPMDYQNDLPRRLVDVDSDLVDEGTHQLLSATHGDVGVLPRRLEVLGEGGHIGHRRSRDADRRRVKAHFAIADAA